MTSLRVWLLRLAAPFGNQRRERDLADKIAAHVLMRVEEDLRTGMTIDEAHRDARIKLGGIEQTKDSYRARRGLPRLENFLRDLRFGARTLRQNLAFTIVAVLTLALGIGLNTCIFTILNAAAWRLLPVPHAEELVAVSQTYRKLQGPIHRNVRENASFFSYSEYTAYRDQNHVFSGLLAYAPFIEVNMGGAHPKHLIGALTSCNYFDVLEITLTLGRGFTQAECIAGNAPVVVLSDGLWRSAFGADASIIGKPVILNRIPFTVIGIATPGFQGSEPIPSQFWAPVNLQSSLLREPDRLADDSQSWLGLLGRTKGGISAKQTRADLGVIAGQIDLRDPGRVTTVAIDTATLFSVPEERIVLLSMGGALLFAVSMVLLIACVNVASLLLARAAGRRKEIAVRLAMGAGRGRLIQQLLTESLLVALLAGLLGSLISFWSTTGLVRFLQSNTSAGYWPVALNISPDVHVLAYALGLTLLTGIAFGLAPALQSSRADLACAMKGEGADSGAKPRPRDLLRGALVAAQVAACMVLLLAAGLLLRGLHRAQTIDLGFRMKNVAAISLDLNGAGYNNHRAEALQRQLLQQIATLPGVNATAQASSVPLDDNHRATDLSIPGREEHVGIEYNYVSPGFFSLLGIPIVRGRNFTGAEGQTGTPVAILTESTTRRLWPSEDPVGKTIHLDTDYAVVGVAKDAQVSFLGRSDNIYAYLPAGPKQQLDLRLLISGTAGSPTAQNLRATVTALDPELAVAIVNIEENLEPWLTPGRIFSILSGFLSGLALLLAAMGVYGLVSYVVSCRVREIGIRMALGADNRDVMALVLRKAVTPVVIGTLIGIAGCAAVAWALTTILPWDISLRFLYGISPVDPVAFLGVPGFLLGVAALASYLPARRAMKIDPMVALRDG